MKKNRGGSMSEKHKAILMKGNAEIAAGNHEGFLKFCADDTLWTFVGDQTLQGKEAVRQWMKTSYTEPPRVSVDNLIAEGEFLTAIGEVITKGEDGNEARSAYCDVWRFREDKLVELKAFVIAIKNQR
jgi:ketosteroid isomerase-like protein